jgi:CheY-like chemotaxis protein
VGHKVLLVDDDVRNLFAVTCLLERTGIQVLPARSGKEGLQLLSDNPDIELVLMDIMMPEMDGYQATREIRQRSPFSDLPIVALTAKAMPGDREKCLEAGCTDFIPKPVQSDVLLACIARSLKPQEAHP